MTTLTRRLLLSLPCQSTCFPKRKQPASLFAVQNWDHVVMPLPFSSSATWRHDKENINDNNSSKDKSRRDNHRQKAERRERTWNKRFEMLKAYANEMRKKHPDEKYLPFPPKDYKLFFWLAKQRYLYQQTVAGVNDTDSEDSNVMSDEHMQKLESLGFVLSPRDDFWDLRFEQLVEFIKEKGCFPYEMEFEQLNEEEKRLYWWCQNQKKRYSLYHRGGREVADRSSSVTSAWTPDREARLAEIGFCWNSKMAQWNARFEELKAFRAHHGNCLVPVDYAPNKPLATWVGEQRTHYRRMKDGLRSSMTAKRVELLDSVGFAWNAQDARWLLKYQDLEEHVDLNGPGVLPKQACNLRRWLDRQLKLLHEMREGKQNTMTEERARLLAKLGYA